MEVGKVTVTDAAHHRNGIGGLPFTVVKFTDSDMPEREFIAVLMDLTVDDEERIEKGLWINPPTAVFDLGLLAEGDIDFGSNSWRGDNYDTELRAQAEAMLEAKFNKMLNEARP